MQDLPAPRAREQKAGTWSESLRKRSVHFRTDHGFGYEGELDGQMDRALRALKSRPEVVGSFLLRPDRVYVFFILLVALY